MNVTHEKISASICVNLRLDLSSVFAPIRVHSRLIYNAPAFLKIRICIQATRQINGNINMA